MALADHLSRLDVERSLPSLPAVALDVLAVCSDPDGEVGDLADALSRDPVLSGQVLELANSAFYSRGTPVTTLYRAAMVLGMQALQIVALGFTLANEMPRRGAPAGLELRAYWHRSLLNAVISRALAWTLEERLPRRRSCAGSSPSSASSCSRTPRPGRTAPSSPRRAAGPPTGSSASGSASPPARPASCCSARGACPSSSSSARRSPTVGSGCRPTRRSRRAASPTSSRSRESARGTSSAAPTHTRARSPSRRSRGSGWRATTSRKIVDDLDDECLVAADMLSIELPEGITPEALLEQAQDRVARLKIDALVHLDPSSPLHGPADWS
jgi:hypothetical protein